MLEGPMSNVFPGGGVPQKPRSGGGNTGNPPSVVPLNVSVADPPENWTFLPAHAPGSAMPSTSTLKSPFAPSRRRSGLGSVRFASSVTIARTLESRALDDQVKTDSFSW